MADTFDIIPYYKDMGQVSWTEKHECGFFDDGCTTEEELELIEKTKNLSKSHLTISEGVVIISFGCFNPIHDGHITGLLQARDHYQRLGIPVGAMIMIPSHDLYCMTKPNSLDIMSRIIMMQEKLDGTGIQIDWEPALKLPHEVNFPLLVNRFADHSVAIVVGSDNAGFGVPFIGTNVDVFCVQRGLIEPEFKNQNTILLKSEFYNLNSTDIRNSDLIKKEVSNAVPMCLDDLKPGELNIQPSGVYLIRDDKQIVTPEVVKLFKTSTGCQHVHIINLEEQIAMAEDEIGKYCDEHDIEVLISLDKHYASNSHGIRHINVRCSRIFKEFGYQKKSNSLYLSQEDKDIMSKINQTGLNVLVVDDDRSSGFTMSEIKKILPNTHEMYLHEVYLDKKEIKEPIYDIVDISDFVDDGLLMESGKRALYYFPSVNLWTRAKILPSKILHFCQSMKKLLKVKAK
jgi:nicotinic acid mononucleotide adenylyltransferase/hypoxanthine-guanine phosphoribosyltransferase